MKVKLARTAGFCMGVRRAVEMVLEESNRRQEGLFTFGPLIHNAQVLSLLAERGVKVTEDVGQLPDEATVVIRAHGLPPDTKAELKSKAGEVLDATCPRVIKVQALIHRYTGQGFFAVILGDEDHAEVRGLVGHARGECRVIGRLEEVDDLPDCDQVLLVAQTTQSETLFDAVAEKVKARWPEAEVFKTICHATHERQAEARSLAAQVDALVVVGSVFSANTQRLVKIAQEAGGKVLAVEKENDLDPATLRDCRVVGVTAGASTPNWLIRTVVEKIRAIPGPSDHALKRLSAQAYRFLLKSNFILGLGGAGLTLASLQAQGLPLGLDLLAVAFCYLYAMHTLNHFLDRRAAAYNDPDLFVFLERHRLYLAGTALAAAASSLVLALGRGGDSLAFVSAVSILGLIYSIPLVPTRWQHLLPYAKLKDFPGSKTLSIALAWGAVVGFYPALAEGGNWGPGLVSAVLVAGLAFLRSALIDILDIQGDLLVGKETLAIALGEEKTLRLLEVVGAGVLALIAGLALWGWLRPAVSILTLPVLGLAAILLAYQRKLLLPGAGLSGLVEANFILAGLAAAAHLSLA